jgi:hypothetical protein
MADYLVRWEINIEADSPKEAAQMAKSIQLDPTSIANVFFVDAVNEDTDYDVHTDNYIDLDEEDAE